MRPFCFFLLFLCSSSFASSRTFEGWEKVNEETGISVYKKKTKNEDLLAFGGVGEIDEPFLKVVSVILDVERSPQWIPDVVESKVIKWTTPLSYIEFDHVGTPFILKDREFLTEVKISISADKKVISFENFDVDLPEQPAQYVRGKLTGSNFEISSLDDGKRTRFHAEVHCDPVGNIPKWLVNLFQNGWPIDTFNNLKKHLKRQDLKIHPKIAEYFGRT